MWEINPPEEKKITKMILDEFLYGRNWDLSPEEQEKVGKINNSFQFPYGFSDFASQECHNQIISAKFNEELLNWKDFETSHQGTVIQIQNSIRFRRY